MKNDFNNCLHIHFFFLGGGGILYKFLPYTKYGG